METIRGLMQFTAARIESLTFTPAEKDPTASLVLSADLTPDLAETMKCRDAVYRADGAPHPGITRLDLGDSKLRDIDLSLPCPGIEGAFDAYRPELVYGFRVDVDDDSSNRRRVHMRARIKGRYEELALFVREQNVDDFEFSLRALQQEFDWTGTNGSGKPVAMDGGVHGSGDKEASGPLFEKPEPPVNPCVHCDRGEPLSSEGFHMVDGEPRECLAGVPVEDEPSFEDEKAEVQRGPALVDMSQMGVKGRRRQKTRADLSGPSPEELQAAAKHLGDDPVFPVN